MDHQHLALVRALEHASQCIDLAPTHVCLDVAGAALLSPRALCKAPAQKERASGSAFPRVRDTEKELRGPEALGDFHCTTVYSLNFRLSRVRQCSPFNGYESGDRTPGISHPMLTMVQPSCFTSLKPNYLYLARLPRLSFSSQTLFVSDF